MVGVLSKSHINFKVKPHGRHNLQGAFTSHALHVKHHPSASKAHLWYELCHATVQATKVNVCSDIYACTEVVHPKR